MATVIIIPAIAVASMVVVPLAIVVILPIVFVATVVVLLVVVVVTVPITGSWPVAFLVGWSVACLGLG